MAYCPVRSRIRLRAILGSRKSSRYLAAASFITVRSAGSGKRTSRLARLRRRPGAFRGRSYRDFDRVDRWLRTLSVDGGTAWKRRTFGSGLFAGFRATGDPLCRLSFGIWSLRTLLLRNDRGCRGGRDRTIHRPVHHGIRMRSAKGVFFSIRFEKTRLFPRIVICP